MQEQPRKDAEADQLTERCGQRRARDAHIEDKDEQRVECDVQESACADAVHGEHCLTLGAQGVAQHERGAHDGRSQQNNARVAFGVGENRFR